MTATFTIFINNQPVRVALGDSVAAALLNAGYAGVRRSVTGERRAPLCGMGICYECRATINGWPQQRSCLIACEEGMRIETNE